MLMVPAHVYGFIERIQNEFKGQKKQCPKDKKINSYIHEIKNLREQLERDSIKSESNYSNLFEIITQIIEIASYLPASSRRNVYHEIIVDSKLTSFVNQRSKFHLKRKQGMKEIEQLIESCRLEPIKKGISKTVFKYVENEDEWIELIYNDDESKMRIYFVDNNSNEFLKIYHTQSKMEITGFAKDIKNELVGKGEFKKYKNAFNVWFKYGGISETYYIYILN